MDTGRDFSSIIRWFSSKWNTNLWGRRVEQSNSESWDLSRAVQICSPLTSKFWMQHYPRHLWLKSMLAAAGFSR